MNIDSLTQNTNIKRLDFALPGHKLSIKSLRIKLFNPYRVFYWKSFFKFKISLRLSQRKNFIQHCFGYHVTNLPLTVVRQRCAWKEYRILQRSIYYKVTLDGGRGSLEIFVFHPEVFYKNSFQQNRKAQKVERLRIT